MDKIELSLTEDELRAKIAKTLRDIMIVRGQERADEVAQFIIDDLIGRQPDLSDGYPVTDASF
jgi:hypothetical protein